MKAACKEPHCGHALSIHLSPTGACMLGECFCKRFRTQPPPRPVGPEDELCAETALTKLRGARDLLAGIGANKAADAVRRAMKSTEGAIRHIHSLASVSRDCANDNRTTTEGAPDANRTE